VKTGSPNRNRLAQTHWSSRPRLGMLTDSTESNVLGRRRWRGAAFGIGSGARLGGLTRWTAT